MTPVLTAAGVAAAWLAVSAPSIVGSWRLDRPASRLRGELTVIGRDPKGYSFDFGAVRFVLPDDGRFHPTVAGRETSLRRLSPRRWRRVHRIHGVDVDESLITLSPDGRRLTIRTTASGRPVSTERLDRQGAGRGLAGAWRSTRAGVNVASSLSFSDAGAGAIRWGAPADGDFFVVTPDGPAAPDQGPRSVRGVTLSVRTADPRTLAWVEAINGRPYVLGRDTVSSDGTVLTETTRPAGRPGEAQQAVYRREAPR